MYRKSDYLFVLPLKKNLPTKVGYFSKIEEIFPYCPNGPKLKILFENLAQEPFVYSFVVTFKYLVCICSVGDHQFDEFEKNHPEMTGGGYEFNHRSLIVLIPSSANFPKVPSRKKNGFEKIQDRFCEIPVNIPGEFSSRVYNHRKPIKLDAHRVYLDSLEIGEGGKLVVKSYMKNILFDFPMCLKSCIGK